MGHYQQLAQEERHQVMALEGLGMGQAAIARELGRGASTVGRELRRSHSPGGYQAATAQRLPGTRGKAADKYNKRVPGLVGPASAWGKWSPEQIAGPAKAAGYPVASHEWVYQLVLRDKAAGGGLAPHLGHHQRRYRRRYGVQGRRGKIPNRVGTEDRPPVVGCRHTVTLGNGREF